MRSLSAASVRITPWDTRLVGARLRQAWPTNLAAVRRHFLDHVRGLDLKKLAAAMQKIAT